MVELVPLELELAHAHLHRVAVAPDDLGAARAGLRTAWIDRDGSRYPSHLLPPELRATSIGDLARQLTG